MCSDSMASEAEVPPKAKARGTRRTNPRAISKRPMESIPASPKIQDASASDAKPADQEQTPTRLANGRTDAPAVITDDLPDDRRAVARTKSVSGPDASGTPANGSGPKARPTPADRQRERLAVISSAELAATDEHIPYLIDRILVAGQPCIVAGGKKCLKTNLTIDLCLSLAQGGLFLGKFKAQNSVRVALLSGESGRATIAETGHRIARSRNWSLEYFENALWGFRLPRIGDPGCKEALADFIQGNELAAVVIDPTYLALPLGDSAANLFEVGEKLADVNEVFQAAGCTPIFVHHTRKNPADPFEPPELEDIAWAGFQEWARQWLLIGRRKKYDPDQGGHHELWLNVGGSAGHSSLWAVNVDEGTRDDEGGRRWEVKILKASEARAQAASDQEQQREAARSGRLETQSAADREKILRVFDTFPDGQSKTVIKQSCGVRFGRFEGAFAELVASGQLEPCTISKGNNRAYEGFRRRSRYASGTQSVQETVPDAIASSTDTPLMGGSVRTGCDAVERGVSGTLGSVPDAEDGEDGFEW
jgi:hypothetical protein